jgi:YidC/Oxa1 family membrane protein insertase
MSRCLALLVCAWLLPMAVQAEVTVQTEQLQLRFAANGDLLEARACLPRCADSQAHARVLGGAPALLSFTSFATEPFELQRVDGEERVELRFEDGANGSYRRWRIPRSGWRIELEANGASRLDLVGGDGFRPPPSAGFGVWLEQPRYLAFDGPALAVRPLDEPVEAPATTGWTGFRSRFWAALLLPERSVPLAFAATESAGTPALTLSPAAGRPLGLSLYLGPVEPTALRSADPVLGGMMYAPLWFWLRWICAALYWLLSSIHGVLPSWGLAIMALSVVVHFLMRPLTAVADRVQENVHRTEAKLAPELEEIRRNYKGEEQANRVLALYKAHGVHPLYSLKSLAGVAVVIPVFIGAFNMLAENVWLDGRAFLWIDDLSRPDHLFRLPFEMPFFGGWLNLLPFLMTGLSVLASALHRQEAMDAASLRRHKRNLLLMALAFLVLFYTFPAGMVLYWTTNNLLSVAKYSWHRVRGGPEAQKPRDQA